MSYSSTLFFHVVHLLILIFFFQAEDGIRDGHVTGVQTCALPIYETARGAPQALRCPAPGTCPACSGCRAPQWSRAGAPPRPAPGPPPRLAAARLPVLRSEEHTSELQSRGHLVCRLLLEKKKTNEAKGRT